MLSPPVRIGLDKLAITRGCNDQGQLIITLSHGSRGVCRLAKIHSRRTSADFRTGSRLGPVRKSGPVTSSVVKFALDSHMRAIGVKRALHCVTELAAASYGLRASPRLILFLIHINNLPMWALWSCGRRISVVQAQRQIHRVLLATDTAAGETMRPRRATRGQSKGSSPLGASSCRKWVHR